MNGTSATPAARDTSRPAGSAAPAVDQARLAAAVATVRTSAGVWSALPADAPAAFVEAAAAFCNEKVWGARAYPGDTPQAIQSGTGMGTPTCCPAWRRP